MKRIISILLFFILAISAYGRTYNCSYEPSFDENFVEGFDQEIPITVNYKQGYLVSSVIDYVEVTYIDGDQEVNEQISCEKLEGTVGIAHICRASEESLLDHVQIKGISDVVYFSTKKIPNIIQHLTCESSLFN